MQRRQAFHTRIGLTLEQMLGERADEECELLAHHFGLGDDPPRAIHYLLLAAQKAQSSFSNVKAAQRCTRLLELYGEKEDTWQARFDVLQRRQKLYWMLTLPQERLADIQAMLALAESHNDPARTAAALGALADLYAATSRFDEAIRTAHEALEGLRLAGDHPGEAAALHTLGFVAYVRGQYDQARPLLEQAVAIRQELGDQDGEGWSELYLYMMLFMTGEYENALQHACHAMETAQQRSDWMQTGIHQTNAARILTRLGQYEQALAQLHASLEMKSRLGDRNGIAFSHYAIGLVQVYLGQPEQAQAAMQQSLEIRLATNDPRGEVLAQFGLGLAALGMGTPNQALPYLQRAVELGRTLGMRVELPAALSWQAQAHLALGDTPSAQAASGEAMRLLAETANVEEPQAIHLNHYRVRLALHDPAAAESLRQADQVMQTLAGRIQDQDLRNAFLTQVKANQEIQACLAPS
jgi:tetratricopeptide (TPR) repeat protein